MTIRRVVLVLVAGLAAGGCAWTPKPYARDPLVRHGRARRADPRAVAPPPPRPDPQPPLPPDGVPSTGY